MKKCAAILLMLMLCLCSSGCSLFWPDASDPVASGEPVDSAAYEWRWSYQRLSPRLQEDYVALFQAVTDHFDVDSTVKISKNEAEDSRSGEGEERMGVRVSLPQVLVSLDEAQELYIAFTRDNPQFFYLGSTYNLEGYSVRDQNYYNALSLVFTMNAAERRTAQTRLEAAVADCLRKVRPGEYDYGQELALHDALLERCVYDEEVAERGGTDEMDANAFTAYGALVEGRAVCEGYSRGMQLLLHEAGIDCTLVSGSSIETGVSHMWNMVTIDGRNYHLDPTWDDSERVRHIYFNLTSEEIARTHRLDEDNIGIDTCTATEANFYRQNGTDMDTYDRQLIAETVARQVWLRQETIEMRFTSATFANAVQFVRGQNGGLLLDMTNTLLKPKGLEMWDYAIQVEPDAHMIMLYPKEND